MPEISRFFGIVVAMFYGDHAPPHFHVRYAGHRAIVSIESGTVLTGELPPRAVGLIAEWVELHRSELRMNWIRARAQEPLLPVPPLE